MLTRKRSTLSRGRKRDREDGEGERLDGDPDDGPCEYGCSHAAMIAAMKRDVAELKGALERERELRERALVERVDARRSGTDRTESRARENAGEDGGASGPEAEARSRLSYELDVCRRDLEDAKQALDQALEERDSLLAELAESAALAEGAKGREERCEGSPDSHPHLDWVGRHYLAVSLPEDRMFAPGQPVTPVGVLQKLFEMRVGDKPSAGFSILLENVNIALCQAEPEWYAKHFCFGEPRVHANGYRSARKVDTEEFAWLLFEYGAQAPFVEVLAGLLNVLSSAGKGGVTTVALHPSKGLYAAGVTLFRETVSRASEAFRGVRERARRAREALGSVSVPVDAGLPDERGLPRRDSTRARNGVLRSVLEGVEAPRRHVGPRAAESPPARDPFGIDRSLSAFIRRRGLEERGGGGGRGDARPPAFAGRFDEAPVSPPAGRRLDEPGSRLADRVRYDQLP